MGNNRRGERSITCLILIQYNTINPTMIPIYGTTMSGTETIFAKWMNGEKEQAIKFLVTSIRVNEPKTPHNTEQMAKETIEKWLDDNF